MARSLVIVESPAKAKTINKYLGRGYNVKASYGHVMDLPKKTIGILLPGENGNKKKKRRGRRKGKPPKKKVPKPIAGHLGKYFRADLRGHPEQAESDQRPPESGDQRRRDLPGGRPGPRRRSHMRPPEI